jgi:hypothetical protein
MISATIVGSLVGFLGSTIGPIVGLFQQKDANKLEVTKMEKAAELMQAGFTQEQSMYALKRADTEQERLIGHDIALTKDGKGFIGALQRGVRPIITYAFFALFTVVKWSQLDASMTAGVEFNQAIMMVWDDNTSALFATVLTFWFGNRVWEKMKS